MVHEREENFSPYRLYVSLISRERMKRTLFYLFTVDFMRKTKWHVRFSSSASAVFFLQFIRNITLGYFSSESLGELEA